VLSRHGWLEDVSSSELGTRVYDAGALKRSSRDPLTPDNKRALSVARYSARVHAFEVAINGILKLRLGRLSRARRLRGRVDITHGSLARASPLGTGRP